MSVHGERAKAWVLGMVNATTVLLAAEAGVVAAAIATVAGAISFWLYTTPR